MNVIIKIKKIYKISAIVFIYKKILLVDLKIEKESKKIMLLPNIQQIEKNGILIEHEGRKIRIITEGVKLKKVRRLQKAMKKFKDDPEKLMEELQDIGIRVEEVKEEATSKVLEEQDNQDNTDENTKDEAEESVE